MTTPKSIATLLAALPIRSEHDWLLLLPEAQRRLDYCREQFVVTRTLDADDLAWLATTRHAIQAVTGTTRPLK